MTDVPTTCAVVIFRVKVSSTMSVDSIKLWFNIDLIGFDLISRLLSRDVIGYEDS